MKMKMGLTTTLLFMVASVALWHNAWAQSGCTSALLNLSPCLNYVMGNITTPSSPCCTQVANIVQSQPSCLCLLFNNNIGFTINQTLALQLPGACNVNTPPISQCNSVANSPTASASTPAGSPATSPAESPTVSSPIENPETPAATTIEPSPSPSSTAGTGSKTVPSTTTNGSQSDGNAVRVSIPVVALAFIASAASTLAKF